MQFIIRRLTFYIVAAWVAVTVNFFIPRVLPGTPVEAMLAQHPQLTASDLNAVHHPSADVLYRRCLGRRDGELLHPARAPRHAGRGDAGAAPAVDGVRSECSSSSVG